LRDELLGNPLRDGVQVAAGKPGTFCNRDENPVVIGELEGVFCLVTGIRDFIRSRGPGRAEVLLDDLFEFGLFDSWWKELRKKIIDD
jgi:hypothetical protein